MPSWGVLSVGPRVLQWKLDSLPGGGFREEGAQRRTGLVEGRDRSFDHFKHTLQIRQSPSAAIDGSKTPCLTSQMPLALFYAVEPSYIKLGGNREQPELEIVSILLLGLFT